MNLHLQRDKLKYKRDEVKKAYRWSIFREADNDDTYSRLRTLPRGNENYNEAYDHLDDMVAQLKHICPNSFDDIVAIVQNYLEKEKDRKEEKIHWSL